jgi:hypothetical protein
VSNNVLTDLNKKLDFFQERRILGLREEEIEKLEIKKDKEIIKIWREGAKWKIVKPKKKEAEKKAISEFLKEFRKKKFEEFILKGSLSAYRLKKPYVTLKLEKIGGGIEEIRFTKPRQGYVYLLRSGEQGILKVKGLSEDKIFPGWFKFWKRRLIDEDGFDGTMLSVKGKISQKIVKKNGTWSLTSPFSYEADASEMREIFDKIAKLKAKRFVALKDNGTYGLKKPYLKIIARFEKEEETKPKDYILEIGKKVEDGYLARFVKEQEKGIFVIDAKLVDKIEVPLISKDIFQIEKSDVQKVIIERGKDKVSFFYKKKKWYKEYRGKTKTILKEMMDGLLDRFSTLEARRAIRYGKPDPKWALAPPKIKVLFKQKDNKEIEIQIGTSLKEKEEVLYYAKPRKYEITLCLEEEIVEKIKEAFAF